MIGWSLTLALLVCFLISMSQKHFYRELDNFFDKNTNDKLRALLVIAHPDDESMFFSPILQYLTKRGFDVEILCLSNGNAEGLGLVRTNELYGAMTRVYGLEPSAVTIVNTERMQDGMDTLWYPEDVQRAINEHIRAKNNSLEIVISFDERC